MTAPERPLPVLPVVHAGVVLVPGAPEGTVLRLEGPGAAGATVLALPGGPGRFLIEPPPAADLTLLAEAPGHRARPLALQAGGWWGRVDRVADRVITGRARNLRHPAQDVAVLAFTPDGRMVPATARAAEGGRFVLILPEDLPRAGLRLGIAGSDLLLDGGILTAPPAPPPPPQAAARLTPLARRPRAIRIKISAPNLREAPSWGDFHFAHALCAAFERLGLPAAVDCVDAWYAHEGQEEVVIALRGRHRLKTDPAKVNLMWLISHPDRIPAEEFADYDHVAVASDLYAARLRAQGLPQVSVLHQATDATVFAARPDVPRAPRCLFVGNSRREYRTMVKWCVESDLPFDLYGGGWEGILPEGLLRATSIANRDLPAHYAGHLILLNDHWDSMRDNGFLSNRLFDGAAMGTPVITDPVAGLAEVFGDSVATAATAGDFTRLVREALADPAPWLARAARARDIVLAAHTFDHRAATLAALIERLAAVKEGV